MEFSLAAQWECLLISFVLGILLELVYELFRFLRLLFSAQIKIFFFDVMFVIIASFMTLFLSMAYSEGRVRFFMLTGESSGFLLLRFILKRFTSPLFEKMVKSLRKSIKIVTKFPLEIYKKLLQLPTFILYNKGSKKDKQSL